VTDSLPSVVVLGILFGVQHATDADHVVAVATIVSRTRRFGVGACIGALWGAGHTVTIAVVGALIIFFRVTVPPALGLSMELAVAMMLVTIGVVRIAGALSGAGGITADHLAAQHPHDDRPAFHSHSHAHGHVVHCHPHVHPSERLLAALRALGRAQAVRSVLVGVVHGLAGSAAVALFALATLTDPYLAVAYLILFGVGTVAGMTVITALLALPFVAAASPFLGWQRKLTLGTGLLSLGFGLYLAVQIGFVDGLLLGPASWSPR
jgi:high-affinity nickel-transport protein